MRSRLAAASGDSAELAISLFFQQTFSFKEAKENWIARPTILFIAGVNDPWSATSSRTLQMGKVRAAAADIACKTRD